MAQFRTSKAFDIVFLLILGGLLWWAALHRIDIGDWVFFRTHQPTAQAIAAADQAGLSPAGRRLFYRTNPEFASEAIVRAECDVEQLGCITSKGQVYILDEPNKPTQTTVTAAHEMLHLAYRRLPSDERTRLAPLLDQAIALNTHDATLEDELKNETTAEDRYDEAHSLLGTEYQALPPQLEQYYAQYFTDRTKVLASEAASQQ